MFALLAAGASVASGLYGASQARKAGKLQAAHLGEAREDLAHARERHEPYAKLGEAYLQRKGEAYGVAGDSPEAALKRYKDSPSYALLQDVIGQATEDVKGAHAAMGTLASGGFGKDLSSHLARYTLQDYYNYMQGIESGINTGQRAVGSIGQVQGALAQNMVDTGTAHASAKMGAANAIQKGVSGALAAYGGMSGQTAGSAYPLQYDPSWSNTIARAA